MSEKDFIERNKSGKIIELKSEKKVISFGDGAHILLPKELIGKIVSVNYKKPGVKK